MAQGRVVGIFISDQPSVLPVAVKEARAVAHRGLENDRYFQRTGTFSDSEPEGPGREITLIEQESLDRLREDFNLQLSGEEARRNIVTTNVSLNELVGCKFLVGEVRVEGIRLCHPCGHLEELTGKKVMAALKNRGGLRANILTDGWIRVGDSIVLDESPGTSQ